MNSVITKIGSGDTDLIVKSIIYYAAEFQKKLNYECFDFPPVKFFKYVCKIPYLDETKEVLKHPAVLLNRGGDCDDKVLFNVIYFIKNKLPFKIVLSGNNKDYSHIYTEFFSGDKWLIFDNTYSNNEINKCYGDFKFLSKYDFSNYDFSD